MRHLIMIVVLAALGWSLWAQSGSPGPAASSSAPATRLPATSGTPTSEAASHPEEWLPLVHNSTQPPPEIGPVKLPPLTPQEGDGQAELIHRAALAWFEAAIKDVDKLVPAAEAAADAVIAGGEFYVTGSQGFIAECSGRAGGMAFTNIWDGKHLNKGDVLMIGQLNPREEGPLNAGVSNFIRGDGSVSSGRIIHIASHNWTLVRDMKDHVNPQRWDNGRLSLIDTRAPEGETLGDIAIGQMATCATAWAFQGEMFAAATRKGKTLVTYASIGEPYGRNWYGLFQGQKLHTRYNVPPIPPGKIARDYLRICQRQLAESVERKQGAQYRLAAGRMAKVMNSGGTVWTTSGSHVLTQGAIIPPQLPRLVILGKSYDWRVAYLKKGDMLFLLGGSRYADEAVAAGGQVLTMSSSEGPTDDSRVHIQTYWAQWDSCVNVPDYPVRILPVTGVEQIVHWYSLLAETQKLIKPSAASQPR